MTTTRNVLATGIWALLLCSSGEAQTADTKSLSVPVALPPAYESTISSIGALATVGAVALESNRSNRRMMKVRAALTRKLLASPPPVASIALDKTGSDPSLEDIGMLCEPRKAYVADMVALNYLDTLVKNVDTLGAKTTPPSDILSALKLLIATGSYSVVDKVKVDSATVNELSAKAYSRCLADVQAYEKAYYGVAIKPPAESTEAATPPSIDAFAFLGPIGSLIDTFLSILQPVLINASQIVDEERRRAAIEAALSDKDIHQKISTTGKQLANAVQEFASASKYRLVGQFVEQLIYIRDINIDLSKVDECKSFGTSAAKSGAPNAAFVRCWRAAWEVFDPQVVQLNKIGKAYDDLADSSGVDAPKLLSTILADYDEMKKGANSASNLQVFAADVGQFIALSRAIVNAASSANISALKSEVAAINIK